MFLELLKNKEFNSLIKQYYTKHQSSIVDIILFGSVIRGKTKPNDLDLLIVFKEKEDLLVSYELKTILKKTSLNFQITTKTYGQLFDPYFMAREAVLSEGFSLINRIFLAKGLGYETKAFFKYNIHQLNQSSRMRLQYALYGRDKKSGIAKKLRLSKFADTVFVCPLQNTERFKEFLEDWEIEFEIAYFLVPSRLPI